MLMQPESRNARPYIRARELIIDRSSARENSEASGPNSKDKEAMREERR